MSEILAMAADHNGIALKAKIKASLAAEGYHCIDLGPYEDSATVDYVDFAQQLGRIVQAGDCDRGILICGTGIGMSIAANKIPGVRAAVAHNIDSAVKSREHNDSNVLCLGSWVCSDETNTHITKLWLNEKFGEYRHVRRVARIAPEPKGKVVFANGVFDIVHQGHLALLKWARSLGDYLVVGINSDESVRALKGPERPINSQENRKAVLEAFRFVDEVVIFEELKPINLINALLPKIVVKGGEWLADEVRERDEIPSEIDVKIFPLVEGYSSTRVIQTIRGTQAC